MVSPASVEDADRAAALLRAADDDHVTTVAGLRYRMEAARPEDCRATWKAEKDGELVGWAFAGLDAFAAERDRAFAGIVVHPDHRRAGIGSALWGAVAAHLREIGARKIVAYSRADGAAKSFAATRNFVLAATDTTSAVDPRDLPPPPTPPQGIALHPLSAFSDDPEPLYLSDRESALDEPGPTDISGITMESWRRLIWDHPDCDRELGVAAVADGVVVASTFLFADHESGRAANGGTGVIRAYRGRGFGLLVKQHSLARAAAAGVTLVITQNDETNGPMLAINRKLGYRPLSTGHAWVLER
ncbi:MAG: GNAT family N-acetyltransferase [Gaiellaceae bacterium]